MSWLRELAYRGADRLYGPRHAEQVPGAYAQIDHELEVIDALGFPGYFLIVWDIVEFCRRSDIYCQGRGSAANSAVCYRDRHHEGRPDPPEAVVRTLPLAGARRPAGHRPGHRERQAGGGDPVRLRDVRARQRGHGRERDHVPAAVRGPGHGPGARVPAGPARCVVEAAGRLAPARAERRRRRSRRPFERP